MTYSLFSNGYKDFYKGKRNVQAGWAIINKNNKKIYASGHSLTIKNAESTGKVNMVLHSTPKFMLKNYSKDDLNRINNENRNFKMSHKLEIVECI